MSAFEIGDLVVLTAGSMRMAVESIEGDEIATVWCHEGAIGRDRFNTRLLKKWEVREDSTGRPPFRKDGDRPSFRKDGDRGDRGGDRGGYRGNKPEGDDRPRGKTGWDGKPREKKYFRKED
ncbi:hypothetical protein FDP22_07105 [Paroceanicella profunda]|uniref:DUF2158 domain-containing protein n=1 Tax=Paroceanicella profunda TaxID=2579971 RepID=A0A5B8FZA7_9RHOB|nr:hypothetical protein [Paroceanicella profunda]QDL91573.1 hypothetical protein FDP22_07105 [Paroceanicella profunda]